MELMMVLSIIGVTLAIAAPNFEDFRRNNRLSAAGNDFLAAVQLARTESIKRQRSVSLCPSNNPSVAAASCSNGPYSGWIVFQDNDGDCARQPAELLVRGQGPLDPRLNARSDGRCVSFAPTGFTRAAVAPMASSRIVFCDERGIVLQQGTNGSAARGVELNQSGRAHVTRDQTELANWALTCP